MEFGEFLIGFGRAAAIGDVHACQRAHAVDAIGESFGLVIGGFQIAPRLDFLADVVKILCRIEIVCDYLPGGVHNAQLAIVKGEAVVFLYDAHKHRRKVAERGDLFAETLHRALEPFERALGDGKSIWDGPKDGVAVRFRQWLTDTSRDNPRRVNALSAEALDDLLTELAQLDSIEGEFGILLGYAENIALGRIRVHAQQQIRRG